MLPRTLLVALVALGLLLTATTIPAPFTIDENNYLVTVLGVRQGRLTVPGTEGLPPSRELLYFDPASSLRQVASTPVASTAPPLYAELAFPFSFLGWRGLVALNTVALLAAIALSFVMARRFSTDAEAPWIAAFAVGLASYFYEYGQGLWPHMVTVGLVAGAVYLAARALDEGPVRCAAWAGLLVGVAAGVRYQNAFVLCCLGAGLLLLARQRLRAALGFALGALPPLAASSILNHARIDSWNPISKGSGYLPTPDRIASSSHGFLMDALTMAWARIVDYSVRPPATGPARSFLSPQPESGAYVLVTAVKKAWLQSAPWMIIPLIVLVLVWLPAPSFHRIAGRAPQRQLRLLSLVVLPTLAMFSATGIDRTDGLCFNQRYFCELVPLMAVAFAWSVEGLSGRRRALLAGGLTGATLAVLALRPHHLLPLRHYMVMYIPLALAAVVAVVWIFVRVSRAGDLAEGRGLAVLAFMVGASLLWATTVHLGDDLTASRILRQSRQDYLRQLRPYITDHSAIFASGGIKDALGPISLDLDVVIAVPGLDGAETTKELLEAFLAQGRHVYLLPNVAPKEVLDDLLRGRQVRRLGQPPLLIEVRDG